MIQKPRGMQDIYFDNAKKLSYLENIICEVLKKFNYNEIRTPMMESKGLFIRIKDRGREAELNVEYSFWQKMNECYDNFYNKNNYPFCKIDVNSDNLEEKAKEIISIIKQLKYN